MSEKKLFWLRFAVWSLFACIIPVIFVAFRFDLFKAVSGISLSGWGIFAIIIVAIFILVIAKYLKKGLPFSLFTQCINGFCKIILPLVVILAILFLVKTNIDYFIQSLGCVTLCELVAIPINPFPKWISDTRKNEKEASIDLFIDKFFSKKDDV